MKETTVYARFEKAFSVSAIIENGGEFVDGPYVSEDGFYRDDLPENSEVTIEVKAKEGYYFVGWYTRPDFKTRVTSVKANGQKTITFYARWKKVSVKKSKIVSAELIKNNRIRVKVKVQNGVNGYEYIYSTTPSFAKKSIVRSKRNPKDLSRLKGKKYYIKVRSYKIDSCGNKVYGPYSTIVYCKCS